MPETNQTAPPVINRSSALGGYSLQSRVSKEATLTAGCHPPAEPNGDVSNSNIHFYESLKCAMEKWICAHIREDEQQVIDINVDLKDGKRLLQLLSMVTDEVLPEPEVTHSRSCHITNVENAIEFLRRRSKNSIPNIRYQDIVDGDIEATLIILCFILLEFELRHVLEDNSIQFTRGSASKSTELVTRSSLLVEEIFGEQYRGIAITTLYSSFDNAKLSLQHWAEMQLEEYITANIIPPIHNLSSSWQSGLNFCLLIHRHDPMIIPDLQVLQNDTYSTSEVHWNKTMKTALDIASQYLLIPQYIEPNDLAVSSPNEYIIMLYVNDFYRVLSKVQREESKEVAHLKAQIRSTAISLARRQVVIPTHIKTFVSPDIQAEQMTPPPPTPETPLPSIPSSGHEGVISQACTEQNPRDTLNIENFQKEADAIEAEMNTLRSQIQKIQQEMTNSDDHYHDSHSLQGVMDAEEDLIKDAILVTNLIETFNETGWKMFYNSADSLITDPSEQLLSRWQRIKSMHKELMQTTKDTKQTLVIRQRIITLVPLLEDVKKDIEMIHCAMVNNLGPFTYETLDKLSHRIDVLKPCICDIYEEYNKLLELGLNKANKEKILEQLNDIYEDYKSACEWIEQVKICLVESKRIKAWIGERIDLIHQENIDRPIDPLSLDFSMSMKEANQIDEQCASLAQDVQNFDSDCMSGLRDHVKRSALEHLDKKLSPAHTTTIEITLAVIDMQNQLTRLLDKKRTLTRLSKLRIKWEDLFVKAVQWVASVDAELSQFLNGKARWTDSIELKEGETLSTEFDYEYRGGVEEAIRILVYLEYRITEFDQGDYSQVLDAYQEIEDTYGETLPDHMERRQLGFESAFEDLMKRCEYGRKVVEQHLAMIDAMCQFKQLRDEGEQLRQTMREAMEYTGQSLDEGVYTDRVQLFKKNAEDLISVLISSIPYPVCPKMLTAIGEFDIQVNEETNEVISSTISTCKSSLSLLVDGLEQILSSQKSLSPQQCARMAFSELNHLISWIEDCHRILDNSQFDIIANGQFSDDMDTVQLEKEREIIAMNLDEKEEEILALIQAARLLQLDVNTNTDSDRNETAVIDCGGLNGSVERLVRKHQALKDRLATRGLEIKAVKAYVGWENHCTKTNQSLLSIARKLWDFIAKKARYDIDRDGAEKQSYSIENEIRQHFQILRTRVEDMDESHMALLSKKYQAFVSGATMLGDGTEILGRISSQQTELIEKHAELRRLSDYTGNVLRQRSAVAEFLGRSRDCYHEGEKLRDALTKMTRRIMDQQDTSDLDKRVATFNSDIETIQKESNQSIQYPTFESDSLRPLSHDEARIAAVSNEQVEELMHRKLKEASSLKNQVKDLLHCYREAECLRTLVLQYDAESLAIRNWIEEKASELKRRQIDVASETLVLSSDQVDRLWAEQNKMFTEVQEFENIRLANFHDSVANFANGAMQHSKQDTHQSGINISSMAQGLALAMDNLSLLKQSLSGHSIALDAAAKKLAWEAKFQEGVNYLEAMNEQLRQFTIKKSNWFSKDDVSSSSICQLEMELEKLNQQKMAFIEQIMPEIQLSYDDYVEFFPKLTHPMATPDHVEAKMEVLHRTLCRYQDNFSARSKELELMNQCLDWDKKIKKALVELSNQETTLESLMRSMVRWKSDVYTCQLDKVQLRNEFENLVNQTEARLKETTEPLKEQYNDLCKSDSMYSTNLVKETMTRKNQDLVDVEDRMTQAMAFWERVFAQRCLVSTFISQAETLMRFAEGLRDDMLSPQQSTRNTSELQFLRFSEEFFTLRQELEPTIPFPVRPASSTVNSSNLDDETTNTLVRETIEMHNTRLGDLLSSLQLILDSKDRLSRLKVSIHSYNKQAAACNAWLRSRRDSISNSKSSTTSLSGAVKLKEVVKTAESIECAMIAKNNMLASLELAFDRCKMENIEEHTRDEVDLEELTFIQETHDQLKQEWNVLIKEATELREVATVDLAPTELRGRIQMMTDKLELIQGRIGRTDCSLASDKNMCEWHEEIDGIEKDCVAIGSELVGNPCGLSEEAVNNAKAKLSETSAIAQQTRTQLSCLQNQINHTTLKKNFMDDATAFKVRLSTEQLSLLETIENFKDMVYGSHLQQAQEILETHMDANARFNECKEIYDDLYAHYHFIMENGPFLDIQSMQQEVDEAWKKLQESLVKLGLLVSYVTLWAENYCAIDNIKSSLESIDTKLTIVKEELSNENADIVHDSLEDIHSQLTESSEALDALHTALRKITEQDATKQHACHILKELSDHSNTLYSDLHNCRQTWAKKKHLKAYSVEIERLQIACKNALNSVATTSDDEKIHLESMKENILARDAKVKSAKSLLVTCEDEISGRLKRQEQVLLHEHNTPVSAVSELKKPLIDMLDSLSRAILAAKGHLTICNLVLNYYTRSIEMIDSMNELKQEVSQACPSLTIADIDCRYESLEEAYASFCSIRPQLLQDIQKQTQTQSKFDAVTSELYESVTRAWAETKSLVDAARGALKQAEHYCSAAEMLLDVEQYVEATRNRLNNLIPSGKGLESEIQELQKFGADMQQALSKKTKKLEAVLEKMEEKKEELQEKRDMLTLAVEQLDTLWESKRKGAYEEGDLNTFMRIIEQLDEQFSKLSAAIASTEASDSVKREKTGLQALIKLLVSAYKLHRPVIKDCLAQAKIESQKQYGDDNKRVIEKLSEVLAEWTKVQSSAAARERELQGYINQIDQEFFCKLAATAVPGTPRKRQNSLLQGSRLSPPPPLSFVAMARYPVQEQLMMRRRSKTPVTPPLPGYTYAFPRRSVSEVSYTADPKNELDMEMGKVINASPFRVKVKMVPGEVGKYWFGEENPRLVYCRILPSQLVMVRVGGGWVELSKYLRDHGHTEGIVTPKANEHGPDEQCAFQESYLQPLCPTSPSGRPMTRGGNGCSSSSNASLAQTHSSSKTSSTRSRSPVPSGYVEGDTFVRIDSVGNHVAVRMTKAEEGARMSTNKRRSNAF